MPASEVVVARQPIFDPRLRAVGYELLFRPGQAGTALVTDPETATATVVLNSFTELVDPRWAPAHHALQQ